MNIRAFITHKLAEHFSDCQDRFCINQNTKSVALADGMSQSYQQKIWADLLVNSYASKIDFVPNTESIKELSFEWRNRVVQYIEELRTKNAPEYLIIMNENALAMHKSAGATFLGIRFEGNKWTGDVLGDSCLIEIENKQIKRIHTSQQGDEFDNHPDYFDSEASKEGKGEPVQISGEITPQTSILLVSDPFSDFLNEKMKEGKDEVYLRELLAVDSHEKYEDLVANWRNSYGMHNDDSTLIIIEYDGSDDLHYSHIDDVESLILKEKQYEANEQNLAEAAQTVDEVQEIPRESSKDTPKLIKSDDVATPISKDELEKTLLENFCCNETSQKGKKNPKGKKRNGRNGIDIKNIIRKFVKFVCEQYNITKK